MYVDYKKYVVGTKKNVNKNIAHISDIHFSLGYNIKRFDVIYNKILDMKPDYICITGDLIDSTEVTTDPSMDYFYKFIRDLSLISKVIISIGNHDYYKITNRGVKFSYNIEWLTKIKNNNIIILDNDVYSENGINFVGFNPPLDFYFEHEVEPSKYNYLLSRVFSRVHDINKFNLLLVHTPFFIFSNKNYNNIKEINNIDLVLTGHTHGGMVPSFFPTSVGIVSPSKKIFPRYVRGYIKRPVRVIINGGVMKLSRKSKLMKFNDIYPISIANVCIENAKN